MLRHLVHLLTTRHAAVAYAGCLAAVLAALPALRRGDLSRAARTASAVLLVGTTLAVLSLTLGGSSAPATRVNLVPGGSILELGRDDNRNAIENVVGNVLVFCPVGFLGVVVLAQRVHLLPARRGVGVVVAAAFGLSVSIEVLQLVIGDRWVDVDDVILNTLGAAIGAGAARAASVVGSARRQPAANTLLPARGSRSKSGADPQP